MCTLEDVRILLENTLTTQQHNIKIFTINAEFICHGNNNRMFIDILKKATLNTVDGFGVKLAIFVQIGKWPPLVTGLRIVDMCIECCRERSLPIMIIGAAPEVRCRAEKILAGNGIPIIHGASPWLEESEIGLLEVNPPERPCVVLVAMGVVKQELVIDRLDTLWGNRGCVFVGCGGAIDYVVGDLPRPSDFVSRIGMSWLFRLLFQTKQRWARQARTLPPFIYRELFLGILRCSARKNCSAQKKKKL